MDKLFQKIVKNYDNLKYELLKAQTFDATHFGFSELYYQIMESDRQRIGAFQNAFELHDNLKGAVICEVGVGHLPLTKLYMPYVKKAYLIENNPDLIPFVRAEIAKYPWADKVELIVADAREVHLPQKMDYIIGELMSIYCANEFQVQIFQHLRQFLKPKGKLLPNRIINFARFCFVDFDGDIQHYPVNFSRHRPMFLSPQFLVNEIDFYKEKKQGFSLRLSASVCLTGIINALYLESYIEVAEGANFTGTDSLMPPTILKTNNTKSVKAGDSVTIELHFDFGTSLDQVSAVLS